jgi:hypothetical protein
VGINRVDRCLSYDEKKKKSGLATSSALPPSDCNKCNKTVGIKNGERQRRKNKRRVGEKEGDKQEKKATITRYQMESKPTCQEPESLFSLLGGKRASRE